MATSKPAPGPDSELYGDIYGDDDSDCVVEPGDENELDKPSTVASTTGEYDLQKRTPPENSTLPNKPLSPNSGLSYSAQVAQQFSAYRQTPSQERKQKSDGSKARRSPVLGSKQDSLRGVADNVFGKKPSEMHDAGKLFIGGLSWDTTDEGLRGYFSHFGKVDACTIMRDVSGASRGFAFLTFEDPDVVTAVVSREHVLDGKMIDPKRAIPREEHLRNTRYFVGGLSPITTSDSMRQFFQAFGKVVDAAVMLDRESGRSKCFGFITFEDGSNADQFVGKTGLVLDDKQIEVKLAQPRSQRDQSRPNAPANNREASLNGQPVAKMLSTNTVFGPQYPMPMSVMFQQPISQVPLASPIPLMNLNPMMVAMNMGINGLSPMGSIDGLNMVANMTGANPVKIAKAAGMQLGMGPLGLGAAADGYNPLASNAATVNNQPGMHRMGGGFNAHMSRMMGPGPSRMTYRGQHNFHPYTR